MPRLHGRHEAARRSRRAFFYHDVFVTCAEADRSRTHHKAAPLFIAEVLSSSTSAYDRGQKFAHYRNIPELREYLLIDTERLAADLFRRDESGHWGLYPTVADEIVELAH